MTPEELKTKCEGCIKAGHDLQLVVPWETRGVSVRIGKSHGPRSREIACARRGQTVAWWCPHKVLAWVEKGLAS